MKFRILVKQRREGMIPVYYPQFKSMGLWWHYAKPEGETVLPHCGFFFRADAERFLHTRYKVWLAQGNSAIIPWNPYG